MDQKKQSIAIIGSGVTGLSAAWLLHNKFDISLFEKNDYLGGHTHTHDIQEGKKELSIDSGFIVYNKKNYPNLVGLFDHLKVETQASNMSFAFSLDEGRLEYSGSDLKGMFVQRSNLFSIKHWRLIREIIRFNKIAHAELANAESNTKQALITRNGSNLTLGEFLKHHKFTEELQQHYLLPMGAAIWSCPIEIMISFPAHSFLRFFANHGLIDLQNRPQWRTVTGGSREYVRKMMADMETKISINPAACSVQRTEQGVKVISERYSYDFDQVIFACHADEALVLLNKPSIDERAILSCFQYQENKAFLHTDESLMPCRKKAWCSWNYLAKTDQHTGGDCVKIKQKMTATYWMNHLQNMQADKNYLVTLNPYQDPKESRIIKKMTYEHPVFDRDAMHAQGRLTEIQGENRTWFCGSYTGYGFHEDALSSSVAICEQLGVVAPWNKDKPYNKIDPTSGSYVSNNHVKRIKNNSKSDWSKVARNSLRGTT